LRKQEALLSPKELERDLQGWFHEPESVWMFKGIRRFNLRTDGCIRYRYGTHHMPQFKYTARSRGGEKLSGIVTASSKDAAMSEIQRMGLFPVTIDT